MDQVETAVRAARDSSRIGSETPDDAVLERVRAGETALYEVLALRHNPRLRRLARRVLSNEADIEEVLQEAHYNAFRSIRQFAGRSSFATWLTRIAIHAALSRLRHRGRMSDSGAIYSLYDSIDTVASVDRNPEQQMQDKETREELEAAMGALPEAYRAVLVLRLVRELSTTEAAALLEISEACTKTRLRRATALLRSRLRARWELSPSTVAPPSPAFSFASL
ncbi:MAG: sigma-70 family RNA polymerase sigma factor [Bryobacteraceae bacterium]